MRAKPYPPDKNRAVVIRNRTLLKGVIENFFSEAAEAVIKQLANLMGLTKSDSAEDAAEEIVNALIIDWSELPELVEPYLAAVSVAGGKLALDQISEDSFQRWGEGMRRLAEQYARDRAAEMVGKKWVDGKLIDNPNAYWRIDESTRDLLRSYVREAIDAGDSVDDLSNRIKNSFAFSESRARMISRTEIAKADSEGAIAGWKSTGLVYAKSWKTVGDDKVSPMCRKNEAQGIVDLDWDYGDGVKAPPQHPNCRCTLLPELLEEGQQ